MKKPSPSIHRAAAIALALAITFMPLEAAAPRARDFAPQEPIRIEVDLVNVLASVVDQNHRPITNLTKDSFEIFDDGNPQKVTIFEPETHLPLDLALMIDSSSSAKMDFHEEREAAAKFIQSVVRAGDGVAVFSFAEEVRQLTGFSEDVPILQHAVRTIKDGAGTALYDAVYLAANTLYARKAERRRVIVLVTDAGETMSKSSFDTARREAIRSGALLYTVVLRPVKNENGRNTAGEHALATITQTTGGAMFFPGSASELNDIFSQINLELRTQYRLGYYPEHKPGGAALRKIELRVAGGYTVRYRQAYIAPGAQLPEPFNHAQNLPVCYDADVNSYLEIAVDAAREAGAILLAELDRPVKITYKGDVDIVTQADGRSEKAIVTKLHTHFPKHAIVAEEGGNHSAAAAEAQGARHCWYVDPLDGTTNFAHGVPWFSVSIALAEGPIGNEELLVGVVYQPVTGEMFTAERGAGACLNNKKIQVSRIDKLATSLLGTGFPAHKRAQNPNINYYWNFTLRSHGVRRFGSAALDLASVACGRYDGFWEFGLNPWDTAAGVLLVREAGGTVTDFAGNPYMLATKELMSSNSFIHPELLKVAAEVDRNPPSPTMKSPHSS